MKSVVIHNDTPSLRVKNCELSMDNCATNVNLGVAGVAGATYFLFCNIYAREASPNYTAGRFRCAFAVLIKGSVLLIIHPICP